MARAPQKGFLSRCRTYFRRLRISVWLLILAILGGLIYLNYAGLPGFVKRPLIEKLRARGIDLQFSRLRLGLYQGLVAENVHFGQTEEPSLPRITAAEVQVRLNLSSLKHLQLQLDSLVVRKGQLTWTLEATNAPPRQIAIENIQTQLRFLPEDQWALDNLTATFRGARLSFSGMVTNASAVREWTRFQPEQPAPAGGWRARLERTADLLEQIHFSSPPQLRLDVRGDARDPQSFGAVLHVEAPGARTPWGDAAAGQFSARLHPADSNGLSRAELSLQARDAQTPWASVTNLHLQMHLASQDARTNVVVADLSLSAGHVQTKWAGGSNVVVTADWTHALTNAIPLTGHGRVHCEHAWTRWGSAGPIDFLADLEPSRPQELPARGGASWAWWTNIQPYALGWSVRAAEVKLFGLFASEVACGGSWRAPDLLVTNLHATLYEGRFSAKGGLNVATRALEASLRSDFDLKQLKPVLTESAGKWMEQFVWGNPPRVKSDVALVLPAWTNRQPDWRVEVQPTVKLNGEFEIDGGLAHRGVEVSALRGRAAYSNLCWHLPEVVVTRPEGSLAAEYFGDGRTKDFYWRFHSTIDPESLRPAFAPGRQKVFELLQFTQAPEVQGEIRGRYGDAERTDIQGRIVATNFTWRGLPVARLEATAHYSNQVVQILHPVVERAGSERATADGLTADFQLGLVFLTNGVSNTDPMFIANAVGPQVARAVTDYHFEKPPAARVYGIIPMHGEEQADLYFELEGGPFDWWKFKLPHIAATVHWEGLHLTLTNVLADFYQGRAGGWAAFDFPRGKGMDYQFHLEVTNTSFHELMAGLSTPTNHLEGWLDGSLTVTAGHDDDWQKVFGYGDAKLREGLIWDIPLFGIFSPVLNGVSPGLGNSRANAANCNYFITNGVVWSDDLEIRASAMRLRYRGGVDLQGKVNARADAELLRDMWLVGPIVSTVFWPVSKLFEFKVTGTLDEPKMDPVYLIPKLIMFPLHPLKTLKGLLPGEANAPNEAPPPPTNK